MVANTFGHLEHPKVKKENIKSSYEPYHIVLGYVLSEGHAETVEEAHYVMTQMDDETVQEIVALDEGPIATAGAVAGALTLGGMGLNAIRKQLDNKKKMEKGGTFKQGSMMDNIQKKKNMLNNLRNNSKLGGNKRVDDVRKNSNDPNVGQKINFGK